MTMGQDTMTGHEPNSPPSTRWRRRTTEPHRMRIAETVDRDGRIWDTVIDVAFVAYDLADAGVQYINNGSVSSTTKTALAADALAAVIPGVTGAGLAVRSGAKAASKVDNAITSTSKVVNGIKSSKNVTNAPKGRRGTTIAKKNGVTIETYGSNDVHKPAHAHVKGKGKHVRIGPNGKPLKGQPELSNQQKNVVDENISAIRREVNKIGKENKRIEEYERSRRGNR